MVEISSHCHVIVFLGGWWVNLMANLKDNLPQRLAFHGAGRCSTRGWSFLPTISEIGKVPLEDTP